MPNREDGLSRDERDAISAELLLKKLRDGLDKRPGTDASDANESKKQAAHISDEAVKLAQSEIIHGEPEEFGSDDFDEMKLREIMNMPAAEDAEEIDLDEVDLEQEPDHIEEGLYDDVISAEEPEEDEEVVPVQVQESDESPWYEDEDEAILNALTYIEQEESKDENESTLSDMNEKEDEDKGFLAQVAKMIEEDSELEPIQLTEDIETGNDFDFIDDISLNDSDIPETTEAESMLDKLMVRAEDGSREYSGLNGSEMNSTEISLISLFGNKEELEEVCGKERAEELIKESDEFELTHTPKKKKFYELFSDDYEYTDVKQKEEIKERYARAFVGVSVRFLICLVFAAVLFFFENAGIFGLKLPDILNLAVYPTVCAMINLQLVLLCALMIIDKLAFGFVSLFKLNPTFESIPSLLLVMSVVYTAVITFTPGIRDAVLYNFPVALAFLLTLLYELMNIKRELNSFNVVSAEQRKYTIRKLSEEERAEDAQLFEEYVPSDSAMFAVTKTGFVDGFFKRINFRRKNKNIPVLMLIVLAEMLLAAGMGIFMKADSYTVTTMVYLAAVLGLPGTVLIAGSHPFYRAAKTAHTGESTIVGDGSLEEYSDGSVVFFDDRDIFPSTGVKINSVKVYGENRIDGVIYYAASIFAKIGGPLADVFSLATIEIGHSDKVEVTETENNGMICNIDGTEIYLGSNDYMKSKDFETPYGESDEAIEKNEGIRLMYIANAEEILAKFYVQYTVDSEYEEIFKQLYKAGMCIGIRTSDPNIDDEFVIRKLRLDNEYPVRVVHSKVGKEFVRKSERADSGVVSTGSVKSLLRSLSLCDRIKYIAKIHGIFEIVSTVLVIFVIYAITALGKLGLGSAYAALYQLFWLIPIMFVTMFTE